MDAAPSRERHRLARRILLRGGIALLLPAAVIAWSFGSYVLVDNGDTVGGRAVTWARDHHLGGAVNSVERWRYSDPPSRTAAGELAVDVTGPTDAAKASTAQTPVGPMPVGGAPPAADGAPTALAPVVAPPLKGEGTWHTFASAGGRPAVWATSIRPSAAFPSVVASVAEMDVSRLRFGLFNGVEVPGGTDWKRPDHVPPPLQPALVAAFNGGFRFDNEPAGYFTEGREVRPMLPGRATLAIDRQGRPFLGEYGRDLTNDGRWTSLRQNLPLIVDDRVSQVPLKGGVNWGRNYHNVIFVTRSAFCMRSDGRYAYVTVGPVDAALLGDSLVALGCVRAMELDINGRWPTFFSFHAAADGKVTADYLDDRMGGSRDRYLTRSSKEFFAAFDAQAVPPGSVLEA